MNADRQDFKYTDLTEKIIKAFYQVYNNLGYGFLEKVYEKAMLIELKKLNLKAVAQAPIKVLYDKQLVGEYFADILVEDKIIVEIKSAKVLAKEHEAHSAIVRGYIERRFGVSAPDMTTEEFLATAGGDARFEAEHTASLNAFLTSCDLVKYARHEPTSLEADQAVKTAIAFVEQTRKRSDHPGQVRNPPDASEAHAS